MTAETWQLDGDPIADLLAAIDGLPTELPASVLNQHEADLLRAIAAQVRGRGQRVATRMCPYCPPGEHASNLARGLGCVGPKGVDNG